MKSIYALFAALALLSAAMFMLFRSSDFRAYLTSSQAPLTVTFTGIIHGFSRGMETLMLFRSSDFRAYPTFGKAPLTVTFTGVAHGSFQGDVAIDFGDGSKPGLYGCGGGCSTFALPNLTTHVYTQAGTYTAKLTYDPLIDFASIGSAIITVTQ
jgi:hypothetical protein